MTAHSHELLKAFGKPDSFDIKEHTRKLMAQYGLEDCGQSSLGIKIESALRETRDETERLRLEMIISNGQKNYVTGCQELELRMKTIISGLLQPSPSNHDEQLAT